MKAPLAPPTPEQFTSRLRSPAVAARVGVWLGVSFGICFVTGLVSHYAQLPTPPIPFPTSPSWGYRVTQGLHVTSGVAAIPLLLVKLWSVLPKFFERLPLRDHRRLLLAVLERGSIGVLVAAAIFQLATGLLNAAQWYPWTTFSFRTTHFAIAWVAIGALVVHVAVKLPIIRDVLTSDIEASDHDRATATTPGALSRRGLVRTTFAAAGVAVLATAGGTVPWLRKVSVFATRTGEAPGGVPINKSARAAGVEESAMSGDWRLEVLVDGVVAASLAYDDLRAMPQHTADLPIACVEGWSAQGSWSGVRLADLLGAAGAPADRDVTVTSLQESGPYRVTTLPAGFAADPRTLLALDLSGDRLALDHGYPCRLIAPNRPGVLQTKWVTRLEVGT
ncbi:molybdopterin-binding protein [Nocardioides oleivorans]|uniref:Molybdopterin-binding protein n=1 Tax=Nocardioides oleivorans TaxID=273676 RepID=A0A4Q2S1A1_9ACTN|nr:molybdopterin-dependent oxidoreductase [Nocardioides oleivorans]RYB93793.1 molybdopterin-binding protein [Nocardioides oleivorans]